MMIVTSRSNVSCQPMLIPHDDNAESSSISVSDAEEETTVQRLTLELKKHRSTIKAIENENHILASNLLTLSLDFDELTSEHKKQREELGRLKVALEEKTKECRMTNKILEYTKASVKKKLMEHHQQIRTTQVQLQWKDAVCKSLKRKLKALETGESSVSVSSSSDIEGGGDQESFSSLLRELPYSEEVSSEMQLVNEFVAYKKQRAFAAKGIKSDSSKDSTAAQSDTVGSSICTSLAVRLDPKVPRRKSADSSKSRSSSKASESTKATAVEASSTCALTRESCPSTKNIDEKSSLHNELKKKEGMNPKPLTRIDETQTIATNCESTAKRLNSVGVAAGLDDSSVLTFFTAEEDEAMFEGLHILGNGSMRRISTYSAFSDDENSLASLKRAVAQRRSTVPPRKKLSSVASEVVSKFLSVTDNTIESSSSKKALVTNNGPAVARDKSSTDQCRVKINAKAA